MGIVRLLDEETINQIAAGEVVERPSSIVKELVENAVDSKASAITVEMKEGGIRYLRVTDDGCGIAAEDVPNVFLRHATSKIRAKEDLECVQSLGFRGEALASIAAVSRVELLTKREEDLLGTRYVINGGVQEDCSEAGCPNGTTLIVRDVFYNVPARKKFLRSAATEGGYITELMYRLAVSHPEISFSFLNQGRTALYTAGNGNLHDAIYAVYGREIASNLIPVEGKYDGFSVEGFIGKPAIARGNRANENYFVNGRYVQSRILNRAIEEAYKPHIMQHKFPFTCLMLRFDPQRIDINVHPSKLEVRFEQQEFVYEQIYHTLSAALRAFMSIPEVRLTDEIPVVREMAPPPEIFETKRREEYVQKQQELFVAESPSYAAAPASPVQMTFPLKTETYRIIGQLFHTYWLLEVDNQLYLIDQHAAHEKILYERMVAAYRKKEVLSQQISPPIIVSLSPREVEAYVRYQERFAALGFLVEPFGGNEYALSAVPADLYRLSEKEMFCSLLDQLVETPVFGPADAILEQIASMSCKAAVKGNTKLSEHEARHLVEELMTLENPFHCPHGRPVIITMSKYEIEKKFKRIL